VNDAGAPKVVFFVLILDPRRKPAYKGKLIQGLGKTVNFNQIEGKK